MMLLHGLAKEHFQVILGLLRCLDIFAISIAAIIAYYLKFGELSLPPAYGFALALAAFFTLIVFRLLHIDDPARARHVWRYTGTFIQAVIVIFLLLAGSAFVTKSGERYSREWFGWWTAFSLFLLMANRGMLFAFLRLMRVYGIGERRVLVIGKGAAISRLIDTIQQSLWMGFRVVTIFEEDLSFPRAATGLSIPILPAPPDMNRYLENIDKKIEEIWLAFPLQAEDRIKTILHELRHQAKTKRLILDFFGWDCLNYSVTTFSGLPVLNICSTPMVGMNRFVKAIEDRLIASLILLLISPVFVVLAAIVKLSSKGPVFYKQKRVGWNGKEFEMLKFRTMPVDAEAQTGPVWAKKEEHRATKIGAFLRRTSLDELPQFINVLQGNMSIVGPRPERLYFVEQFKDQIPRYMQKHMVKAGITGWAQVNGWRGNTSLQKRIEYDLYYIENWSLLFDLKIIFLTLVRGFINKNAY